MLIAAVAAASLLAGCGGKSHKGQTFVVDIDGKNPAANEAFLAYFPNSVTVHPGDSVEFDLAGNGEPHTATLGTVVDGVLNAFAKLPPAQQQNPPAAVIALDAKVPQLFPQGPGDAYQVASNPCVIASGLPDQKKPCPSTDTPDFDGTQSFYNSGWPNSNDKWTVKLSSSTAPGTYNFMCLLHREGMTGKIVVVPKDTAVPTPDEQTATGKKQLAAMEAKLKPALDLLRQGKAPVPGVQLPGPNPVLAGSGANNVAGEVTEFGPKEMKIPVGGSVTWWLIGPHSITFNSDKTNDDIRSVAADGSIHINQKAIANSPKVPGEPPPNKNWPTTGINFKVVATTSWDGAGFFNTGVFSNSFGPPVIEGYTIKFTKAGTYKYLCTVHDDMKGTVIVGGG